MDSATQIVCVVFSMISMGSSELIVPDAVSYTSKNLVYYSVKATWYEAGRMCASKDGQLMLVDSPQAAQELQTLKDTLGSLSSVHTRMVRHDDKRLYDNGTCQLMNTTSWSWDNTGDHLWDPDKQCVLADASTFKWKKRECDSDDEYVCEYSGEPCVFQPQPHISLATLPMPNATMAQCQATCRAVIGCFATAPSGDVTSPPFTRCLFLVVADDSNPMTTLSCPKPQYTQDSASDAGGTFPNAPSGESDPGRNPDDCVPQNSTESTNGTDRWPLADLLASAGNQTGDDCSLHTVTQQTTVTHTLHLTPSPSWRTVYVSLTPSVVTQSPPHLVTTFLTPSPLTHTVYVTPTPLLHTVTLTPVIQTAYVTVSVPASPIYVTATTTMTTTAVTTTSTLCSTTLPVQACPNITAVLPKANKTKHEVLQEMSSVVEELKVDPAEVSKTRRTKESSPDSRPSAQAMGVVAVVLLVVPPALILLLDLPSLLRALWAKKRVVAKVRNAATRSDNTNTTTATTTTSSSSP